MAVSEVFAPRMTSTSGMRSTGLKKCMPTTFSGFAALAAISEIGMVEVLEAKMAVSRAMA